MTSMIEQQQTITTFELLSELIKKMSFDEILSKLYIHKGTLKRWLQLRKIPDNYYNDINHLLGDKYRNKNTARDKDQFYTTKEISLHCFKQTLKILKELDINENEYTFIEPSAGCCNFYNILPNNRRIGIDIEPKGNFKMN